MTKSIQVGKVVATLSYKLHPYRRGGVISYSKDEKDLKPCRRQVNSVELFLEVSESCYKKVCITKADLLLLMREIENTENEVTKEIVEHDEY